MRGHSGTPTWARGAVCALVAAGIGLGCPTRDAPEAGEAALAPDTARVVVAGSVLEVEVAADPVSRRRGLSGRTSIPRDGGMLFVMPQPAPMTMVMRDCPVPIDVAFIDAMGRVVAIHEMVPEPPRGEGETPFGYELRLPGYPSGAPVQFALETAGGRLAALGLAVGDRVHFPARELVERAKNFTER